MMVLLHIGTHKTGSTSIQFAFQRAAEQLKAAGLIYLPRFKQTYALEMAQSLDEHLIAECRAALHESMAQASAGAEGPVRYLMSSELFCGDPAFGYTNAPIVAAHLQRIFADFKVQVIVYLRRQDEFLQSIYTQLIHQGLSLEFEPFLQSLPAGAFDWSALLAAYAEAFGREALVVRCYEAERLQRAGGLINEFLALCGLDPAALNLAAKAPSKNNGYTRHALEVARACNPRLMIEERKKLRRVLQDQLAKQPFESYSLLSAEQRLAIWQQYQSSNQRVVEQFLPDGASCWAEPELEPELKVETPPAVSPSHQGIETNALLDTLLGLLVGREASALRPARKRLITFFGPPHAGFSVLADCLAALGLENADRQGAASGLNARLLSKLGVWENAGQLPAGWQNSVAVFIDAAPAIERLLQRLQDAPDNTFFLCDPNLALTLPLWQSTLDTFGFDTTWVLFHRQPQRELAEDARQSADIEAAVQRWCRYFDTAVAHMAQVDGVAQKAHKRALLSYEGVIAEPIGALTSVLGAVDLDLDVDLDASAEAIFARLQPFLDEPETLRQPSPQRSDAELEPVYQRYTRLLEQEVFV